MVQNEDSIACRAMALRLMVSELIVLTTLSSQDVQVPGSALAAAHLGSPGLCP